MFNTHFPVREPPRVKGCAARAVWDYHGTKQSRRRLMRWISISRLRHWEIILYTGVAAGIAATVVQVLLWLAFAAPFPDVLFRDARLTAALVLGSRVLPPPDSFDASVWLVATFIHFALSIAYAALLGPLASRLSGIRALLAGAVFGMALYVVNLYGFSAVFPWFAQARGGIAAAAHVAFGVSAVVVYRRLRVRHAGFRPGAH